MKLGCLAFLLIVPLALAAPAAPPEPADGDPALSGLFAQRGVTGTLIIESLDGRTVWVHNPGRAGERFLPASTFKIPNTLIALEAEAVRDEAEVIRWDGVERSIPAWNRDQSLSTAFQASCVWFYQELARRVGAGVYRRELGRIGYGNGASGPAVDTFWLDGELRISAREQIDFLKRVYRGELPFRPENLEVLRRLMVVESAPGYVLRAKTGWALRVPRQLGWYVGWLDVLPAEGSPAGTGSAVWFFALNMDFTAREQAAYRVEIVRDALRAKGLLPTGK